MALRRYPVWEDPEIEDWRDAYPGAQRCFPLGALAIGIGTVGLFAFCRPRRFHCYPRAGFFSGGYAGSCYPFLSCTPTFICAPRSCFPAPLY